MVERKRGAHHSKASESDFDRDSQANIEKYYSGAHGATNTMKGMTQVDFNLTGADQTFKDKKHVSFKESPTRKGGNTITEEASSYDVSASASFKHSTVNSKKKERASRQEEEMSQDKLLELATVLAELQRRTDAAQYGLERQLTCENPKLLEVLMEHMVINWDELGTELLGEEIDKL